MTAKSVWNRAQDATREDERQRLMRSLHEHIDQLEKKVRDQQKEIATLTTVHRDLTFERDQLRVDMRDLRRDLASALRGDRL